MARIVLGLATSHSPQLSTPPDLWPLHGERDRRNPELLDTDGRHVSYKDAAVLSALPQRRMNSGTSEVRNWIATAEAVEHLDMALIDYLPCYRSPAGTGCAMGFASGVK